MISSFIKFFPLPPFYLMKLVLALIRCHILWSDLGLHWSKLFTTLSINSLSQTDTSVCLFLNSFNMILQSQVFQEISTIREFLATSPAGIRFLPSMKTTVSLKAPSLCQNFSTKITFESILDNFPRWNIRCMCILYRCSLFCPWKILSSFHTLQKGMCLCTKEPKQSQVQQLLIKRIIHISPTKHFYQVLIWIHLTKWC